MRAELLQYDIRYDRKEKDVQFIAKQLETHLRERFNVLISAVEYGIKDGHLVRQGTEEPFIESIKRGRDVAQKLSQNTIDVVRENAEVIGFEKIDTLLSSPATVLGSKMLSISPKGGEGSKYTHNFYDIFILKEKNGKRCVELSRYSSGLSHTDYVNKLGRKFQDPPQAHPIEFDIRVTSQEIHKALHKEHEYADPADFEMAWNSPRVQFYAEKYKLDKTAGSFNAFLNAFDEVWKKLCKENRWQFESYLQAMPSYAEVRFMEKKDVRQAGGQCPGKSGVDTDSSPFSVSEFGILGKDRGYDFDHQGTCVVCNSGPRALGPCEICEQCVIKVEKEEKLTS